MADARRLAGALNPVVPAPPWDAGAVTTTIARAGSVRIPSHLWIVDDDVELALEALR